jgi:hypothetical protein
MDEVAPLDMVNLAKCHFEAGTPPLFNIMEVSARVHALAPCCGVLVGSRGAARRKLAQVLPRLAYCWALREGWEGASGGTLLRR